MTRKLHLFLVICVVIIFRPEHAEGQPNAKEVADKLLEKVKEDSEFKKKTNPLNLDINDSFGNFHISKVKLPDMGNKLYRDGDTTISFDRETRKINVSLQVALRELYPEVYFNASVKVLSWCVHVSSKVYVKIGHISLQLGMEIVDFERVDLTEFSVKGVGDVKTGLISGISLTLSWLNKLILNEAAKQTIVNGIRNGILNNGKYYIQEALRDVDGDQLRELLKSLGYS